MCPRAAAPFSNRRDRTSRGLLRASSRLPVCSWSAARRRNLSSTAGRKESTLSVAQAFASSKRLSENGAGPFDVAIWFYPAASATAEDVRTLDRLSTLASSLILVPATGADAAKRRPPLVAHLGTRSFFPNYDCDISDLEPAALQLTHEASESTATQVPCGGGRVFQIKPSRARLGAKACARACRNWKRPTAISRPWRKSSSSSKKRNAS